MPVLIGTSGWHYRHWRGGFYPDGLPARRWLSHYAGKFATVEVNNAFYRLPDTHTFSAWAANLPDDFSVAVKASRYLTHVRRLRDPEEPVTRLMGRAQALGSKLGPVLLQLPPNLPVDLKALERTLEAFPDGTRVAVEPRHESWFATGLRALLSERGTALCLTDTDGRGTPRWRTTSWGYVRFHHGRGRPDSCYGRSALRTWASVLAELWPASADIYSYFNNDTNGCAPRDTRRFALAVAGVGLTPTRVPASREAPVTDG
ncbi:MAG: DUF72 domain-containing protein [Actinomycetota bacterium]|nr:DUF72 domain-containing protein [Actinomycetota bacterium]